MASLKKCMAVLLTVLVLISMLPTSVLAAISEQCPNCGSWNYQSGYDPIEEPTCTQSGRAWVGWCGDCGKDSYQTIPALGHDWGPWVSRADATCTEGVTQHRYCNRCGEEETREVAALGHDWGGWITTKEPTCTESGKRQYTCQRCGETVTDTIAALGHNWGNVSVIRESTCKEKGEASHTCSRCGKKENYALKLADHKWGEWAVIVEPKPYAKGYEEHKCSVCGLTEQRDLYPDGTVFQGDRGDAVRELQEALNAAGYDCGTADGIFGNKTEAAVKAAQEALGMEVDGVGYPGIPNVLVAPTVRLNLLTSPANGKYFVVGEEVLFEEGITNNSNYNYDLVCLMFRYNEQFNSDDNVCDESSVTNLAAGESWSAMIYSSYVITEEDLARGSMTCYGAALYPFDDGKVETYANVPGKDHGRVLAAPIKIPVGSEGDESTPDWFEKITLDKRIADSTNPGNGEYYVEGETIEYELTVTNNFDQVMRDVEIVDPLKGSNEDAIVEYFESVQPGSSVSASFTYTVTAADVANGSIWNMAEVGWLFEGDTAMNTINSNEVLVQTDAGELSEDVQLAKSASAPANGEYFVEGETVTFTLVLTNGTENTLNDMWIGDALVCDMNELLTSSETLEPGATRTMTVDYTISAENVETGYVANTATAGWTSENGEEKQIYSNEVLVYTGEDTLPDVTLDKSIAPSTNPNNGEYYVPGEQIEYILTVTNNTDNMIYRVEIVDPLKGTHEDGDVEDDAGVAAFEYIKPGDMQSASFIYTVTEADAANGYVQNQAMVGWYPAPESYDWQSSMSDWVIVPAGNEEWEGAKLVVAKSEISHPANGSFYVPGEEVTFDITVTNLSDTLFENLIVGDMLAGSTPIAELPQLAPHSHASWNYTYTVTDMDAAAGFVSNIASAVATDEQGLKYLELSEQIAVPAGFDPADGIEGPFGVITNMDVVKNEVSSPANGSYYTEGETISYTITCTNTGEMDFGEVILYDSLVSGSGELSSVEHLYVGESHTFYFDYTVTAMDVAAGCVLNKAFALHDLNGYMDTTYSNTVISDTDGNPDDPTSFEGPGKITTPVLVSGEGADYVPCTRTLAKRSESGLEYTVDYCSLHEETQQSIALMAESAATDAAQLKTWQNARTLWQEELDEMYEATLLAADPAGKITVMNERVQFYITLSSREAALNLLYPDQPALVEEKIAELLMNKAVEMCYEIHTAPEARADRHDAVEASEADAAEVVKCNWTILDTENDIVHYAEEFCTDHALTFQMQEAQVNGRKLPEKAWEAVRQLWEVERKMGVNELLTRVGQENRNTALIECATFGNWLEAREDILCALYPDAPATVQEVLAQTVMEQVRLWCSTQE